MVFQSTLNTSAQPVCRPPPVWINSGITLIVLPPHPRRLRRAFMRYSRHEFTRPPPRTRSSRTPPFPRLRALAHSPLRTFTRCTRQDHHSDGRPLRTGDSPRSRWASCAGTAISAEFVTYRGLPPVTSNIPYPLHHAFACCIPQDRRSDGRPLRTGDSLRSCRASCAVTETPHLLH